MTYAIQSHEATLSDQEEDEDEATVELAHLSSTPAPERATTAAGSRWTPYVPLPKPRRELSKQEKRGPYWEEDLEGFSILDIGGVRSRAPGKPVVEPRIRASLRPISYWEFQRKRVCLNGTAVQPRKPPSIGLAALLALGKMTPIGPPPSTIRVSSLYLTQAAITQQLQHYTTHLDAQEKSIREAREDSIRLQGVAWLDLVRRSLQLPIRTFSVACYYYHKLRLANAGMFTMEYGSMWTEACAGSLLAACKSMDTLKKSRDILAAAYNLKVQAHEQLAADDAVFEAPSKSVVGIERMVLEAARFDFRTQDPYRLVVKLVKELPGPEEAKRRVGSVAWSILTDMHRTFAPIKKSSVDLAFASLELATHFTDDISNNVTSALREAVQQYDYVKWSTSREDIMETLLDALDLYTQHGANSAIGPQLPMDHFLQIRLGLNKECNESNIARHVVRPPSDENASGSSTLQVSNGHPTPVSPADPGQQSTTQDQANPSTTEAGGPLRFLRDPQRASDEKVQVTAFTKDEYESYDEEVPIPTSRQRSRSPTLGSERGSDRSYRRDRARGRDSKPNLADKEDTRARSERDRERDRLRDREREAERARTKLREREREHRYHDHRYDDRERRYDDRRDRRYEDRRYEGERDRDRDRDRDRRRRDDRR